MKSFLPYLLGATACAALIASTSFAQTRTSRLVITNANGSVTLAPPTAPGSGGRVFEFPTTAPSGSTFILSETTAGQTITGPITFDGDLTFGNSVALTFGGSTGSAGDVLTSDGSGGYSWETPASGGGGGGGVPTTRTLTTTSPLRIGGGAFADLSADRTISFDFSLPNDWTGLQTFLASEDQGNALVTSINAATTAIGVARGGTGKTSVTANRLLMGNGTGALVEVNAGSDDDILTMVSGVPTWQAADLDEVFGKLDDNITTTANSLESATGMGFNVAADEIWEVEYLLKLGNGNAGIKFGFSIPSGNCTGVITASQLAATATTARFSGDNIASAAVCTNVEQNHFAVIKGLVFVGATGGTVNLKWCRATTSGTMTMHAGSCFRARKIN